MDTRKQAEENLLFKSRSGSHAYGMATATSDLDIRGVFAADRMNVVTPFFPVEQVEGPGDQVIFELSKYVKLVCDQNPNIVELLWVDQEDVLFESPAWGILKEIRGELMTTKLRATYAGYAMQQLKRMQSHNKWINNPQPEEPPRPMDFVGMVHNLSLAKAFNHHVPRDGDWTAVGCGRDLYLLFEGGSGSWFDASGALRTFTREEASEALAHGQPSAIVKFAREEYEAAKRNHESYWKWKRERNKVRGALEEKVGFDGKNAAHLIRLMRTAQEALTEGVIRVRRPDAEELLAIRRGEWSYERVIAEAEAIDARLEEAEARSSLPRRIDQAKVGALVMRMYERAWAEKAERIQVALPVNPFAGGGAPDVRGRVITLDIEGSNGSGGQIVEVAAVEIVGGRRTGRVFHTYVDPRGTVDEYATRIHGLTAEFLKGKPTFAQIATGLLAFLGDSPVVCHHAASDLKMLNHDLAAAGMAPIDHKRVFCSERIGRKLFPGTRFSLDALCDTFGVDRTSRERGHTALVDATLLSECLLNMAQMPEYGSITDVGPRSKELRKIRRQERGESVEQGRPVVSLSEDGRTVTFSFEDGRHLDVPVPEFPAETHEAVAVRTGALLILRKLPEGSQRHLDGYKKPDNPLGPAVLTCRGREVREIWFKGGKPCAAPVPTEEVAKAPGM